MNRHSLFNPIEPRRCQVVARGGLVLALLFSLGCDNFTGAQQRARQQALIALEREQAARAEAEAARQATELLAQRQRAASSRSPLEPAPAGLSAEDLAAGWIALFDGATLFGWQLTSDADWKVDDETIVVSSGEPGLLCTTSQFADYVLRLDFKFAKGTNSGVFLHTPLKPMDPAKDCYELNIAEPEVSPFSTGGFVKRQKAEASAEPDTWHSYEVTMQGSRQTVKLNGQTVLEYDDPAPLKRGYIGLQLNQGAVAFRNIRLRPLSLAPLYNGRDLTGWLDPTGETKFQAGDDESLRLTGGKGQLESQAKFGDFVLQFECRTNAANLNSGVFFRCVPGSEMFGYESQIHHAVKDGDRSKPLDCGTGGIFRRQDARRVMADDETWFHETLVADGPHVAVWVNGYQVTDWTDTRSPDENPRKGLRTAPGTLMLQGHDATTDIEFRSLRAAELAPRGD